MVLVQASQEMQQHLSRIFDSWSYLWFPIFYRNGALLGKPKIHWATTGHSSIFLTKNTCLRCLPSKHVNACLLVKKRRIFDSCSSYLEIFDFTILGSWTQAKRWIFDSSKNLRFFKMDELSITRKVCCRISSIFSRIWLNIFDIHQRKMKFLEFHVEITRFR